MTDPVPVAPARRQTLDLKGRTLREHTARGTIVNASFSIGLAGIGAARQFLVAIFLTAADYGLWGLIYLSVTSILWFMEAGIGDKFIQQSDEDQEKAFQKAFTLNLLWTLLFFIVILIAVPLFAALYGRPDIIFPGCVLAVGVLANVFKTPTWIFYRSMQFLKQRALQAIEPLVGFVVTIGLGIAGAGYWSLVIGAVVGLWSMGIAAIVACPYPLRFRFERVALGEYFSFSWPVVLAAASTLVVLQVAVILGQETAGLAGVGAIGLAGTIAAFADRVDAIVTQTLYPAVCAVQDRIDLLFESFTKSNRLALIWGVPFGLGLTLFAPDLVHYVLGEKWDAATGLLQVFGATAAIKQIGFNWTAYQRAIGQTRPLAAYAVVGCAAFLLPGIPGILAWGLTGYALAVVSMTLVQLLIRTYFLKRLFRGFAMLRHTARALAPCVPAVAAVLALRLAVPDSRPPVAVVAEIATYVAITVLATWVVERDLLRELASYLRGAPRTAPAA
jgi:O-antigen/teichoic acid export membrane protein